jgi:O-antigen biosynthesis protein
MAEMELPQKKKESRSMEATGERYVPWAHDPVLAYEHLHRYAYISRHVRGRTVLDLASGEGYGTAMLARAAALAVGIEIDEKSIRHAQKKYRADNLYYILGSITDIPLTTRFDIIVCFEVIEHIHDHERLLAEVKRLLAAGGIFAISTPNKPEYRILEPANPFHLKELDHEEFRRLLTGHFSHVQFLGQRVHCGSSLWPSGQKGAGVGSEFYIDRAGDEFIVSSAEQRIPLYFIGIASDTTPAPDFPAEFLLDSSNSLLKEKDRIQHELEETIQSQEEALIWRDEQVTQLQSTIRSHEEALDWRASQVSGLQDKIRNQQLEIEFAIKVQKDLQARIDSIVSGRAWQLIQKFMRIRDLVFPPLSRRRQLYERIVQKIRFRTS